MRIDRLLGTMIALTLQADAKAQAESGFKGRGNGGNKLLFGFKIKKAGSSILESSPYI